MSEPPYGPPYRPSEPAHPPQQEPQREVARPQSHPQQPYPQQPYPQPGYPRQPYPQQPYPRQGPPPRADVETSSQVRAAMAARAELGPEYDDAIAAGLADRVEELVAYRTAELRHTGERAKEDRSDARSREAHRFVLGIISLGSGIPITAIAANSVDQGLFGVIAAWAGIVGVNAVFAWGTRRKRE